MPPVRSDVTKGGESTCYSWIREREEILEETKVRRYSTRDGRPGETRVYRRDRFYNSPINDMREGGVFEG